ncbi:MAG: FimB/Mfa2 family fimbrial subunit [Bacteroidales bacterium]|nr:FimB/Mfa2 family fimbrial subunit [Bacteroidales bacterium]
MLFKAALMLAGAVSIISCQKHPVFETEGNCEDVVEVYLKYDYNIQRADMRPYHVGWANVYAIDEKGNVAAVKTVSPAEAADKNSTVKFDGLQPGRYTFAAMAMQSPYEKLAQGQGARFRATFPANGSAVSDLTVKLDRNAVPGSDLFAVDAPANGLDTLWIGRSIKPQGVIVPKEEDQSGIVICDTISLVRDTKYLHLTLHQIKNRADIHDTDFAVRVSDSNGSLAWNNNLLSDSRLIYAPHASWTTALSENGVAYDSEEEASSAPATDPIVERAAHFEISFSRLMYYASASEGNNAVLSIVNASTGTEVVRLNLPYYLSFGRDAYSVRNYSRQEYLDREYDYHLDFFLEDSDTEWAYLSLKVNILPWVMRIQNQVF